SRATRLRCTRGCLWSIKIPFFKSNVYARSPCPLGTSRAPLRACPTGRHAGGVPIAFTARSLTPPFRIVLRRGNAHSWADERPRDLSRRLPANTCAPPQRVAASRRFAGVSVVGAVHARRSCQFLVIAEDR